MLTAYRAILGLALLLAMIGDSSGQSPPEPPRQNPGSAQQQPNTEQRDTDQAPPSIIKPMPAEQTQQKPTDREKIGPENRSNAWSLSDKIAVVATIAAMLQFVALVITIFVLMRTAKRQLRAYVFGNGGSISLIAPPEGDMQLHVDYRFKNFGQTPAYKASMWTTLEIFDVNAPVFSQHTGLGNFVIGPGANSESKLARPISRPELVDIRVEKKAIFVWGEIKYVDAFGTDRHFRFYDRNGSEIPGKGWPIVNSDKPYEAN